jgi:hypothetical protein
MQQAILLWVLLLSVWQTDELLLGLVPTLRCCHVMEVRNITLFPQCICLNNLLRPVAELKTTNVTTQLSNGNTVPYSVK